MNKLKTIDFLYLTESKECFSVYEDLVTFIGEGISYRGIAYNFKQKGWYLPEDQFKVFKELIGIQLDLEEGSRRGELESE